MARYTEKKHARSGGFATGHDQSIGKTSRAGLPEEVITSEYPKCAYYGDDSQDDTMRGIDEVQHKMVGTARKHVSNQK